MVNLKKGYISDHADLTGVTSDQHHAQSHTHASHTSIGANDHHNQVHAIDGADHTGSLTHNILSATHLDSLAASAVRGDLIIANSTPAWSRLAVGAANSVLWSDGTDPSWTTAPILATSLDVPTLRGGTASGGNLTLSSTSHATKGIIILDSKLRLAASANNTIQDSGGTDRITLSTVVPNIRFTASFLRFLSVNATLQNSAGTNVLTIGANGAQLSRLGVNKTPTATDRFVLLEDSTYSAGGDIRVFAFDFSAVLGAATTSLRLFDVQDIGDVGLDLQGNNLTDFALFNLDVVLADNIVAGTITDVKAFNIKLQDGGGPTYTNVTGIDLQELPTGATLSMGLRQRQTSHHNRLAGPTLIGADAAPASGYALELRDDFLLGAFFQELREMTAPSAGATNSARLYAEDNGAGKTRLMALFPTGAAQQVAIEP